MRHNYILNVCIIIFLLFNHKAIFALGFVFFCPFSAFLKNWKYEIHKTAWLESFNNCFLDGQFLSFSLQGKKVQWEEAGWEDFGCYRITSISLFVYIQASFNMCSWCFIAVLFRIYHLLSPQFTSWFRLQSTLEAFGKSYAC